MTYGFLGCGSMGGAIAARLSRSTKEITVSDRSGKAKTFAAQLGIAYDDNIAIATNCDTIFLAVKPQMLRDVLTPLRPMLALRRPMLVSMAAGIELAKVQDLAGCALPIIRIMPNTPTSVGMGVIPYCRNELVSDRLLAEWIVTSECFSSIWIKKSSRIYWFAHRISMRKTTEVWLIFLNRLR